MKLEGTYHPSTISPKGSWLAQDLEVGPPATPRNKKAALAERWQSPLLPSIQSHVMSNSCRLSTCFGAGDDLLSVSICKSMMQGLQSSESTIVKLLIAV